MDGTAQMAISTIYCLAVACASVMLLSGTPKTSRRRKALVAEDNRVCQRVAALMLESLGWEVEVVPDGSEALRRLDAGRFDLVFLDCRMPSPDGYDTAREIRRREAAAKRARHTLIAITADALPAVRTACLEAGMDDAITKPVRLDELRRVVMRWSPAEV